MLFSNSLLLDTLVILTISFGLARLRVVLNRRSSHLAVLKGPPGNNLLFGRLQEFLEDTAPSLDRWVSEYGYVFKIPAGLVSTSRIVIGDPKAVAHIYANDSFGYLRPSLQKTFSRILVGDSMISSDKEDHRRQRRAAAPAFTNGALRDTMSTFYDSAYKLKGTWDALFEVRDEVTIDVQRWINKVTLDSIGLAGFGHDFGSLDGHKSPVSEGLDALMEDKSVRSIFLVALAFPQVLKLPLKQTKKLKSMKNAFSDIAKALLERSRQEKESSDVKKDKSILGALLKGRSQNSNFQLLQDEAVGQGLFLLAGYDTTAISLSWALVELARHPEKQDKLRQELRQFSTSDPTWDQIVTGTACPYLDAVVNESLRLHPAVEILQRTADKDDVLPLGYPMQTPSGETVNSIFVPKGTLVVTPTVTINRSEAFWGPDAKQFVPERWLEENTYPSKDFSGYKHLFTFSDGPRICLGRMFALAEFKSVLSVLVRNFTFELPSGPDTPIGIHKALTPRPKLADETGCVLRMKVRQVTG